MDTVILKDKTFKAYFSAEKVQEGVRAIAAQIDQAYAGQEVLLLPILNGAFMLAADLVRELKVKPQIQFVKLSTYGDEMTSQRSVKSSYGLDKLELAGKNVLIIEDIVDSGFSINYLRNHIKQKDVASVKVATLLFKPDAFEGDVQPEFIGFHIPDKFVVGYGMDYAQCGRELAAIYQLAETE